MAYYKPHVLGYSISSLTWNPNDPCFDWSVVGPSALEGGSGCPLPENRGHSQVPGPRYIIDKLKKKYRNLFPWYPWDWYIYLGLVVCHPLYTYHTLSQGQLVTAELSIPQVGDLNLWCAGNLEERFYTGKTRQLHATHLTKGDRSMAAKQPCQLLEGLEGESPRENVGTLGKNTPTM